MIEKHIQYPINLELFLYSSIKGLFSPTWKKIKKGIEEENIAKHCLLYGGN